MAEPQYYTLLTNIGKAAIANATALGTRVDFAKIKVGDGGGSSYTPMENQTALKKVVWESTLEHVQADEKNPSWIVIQKTITGDTGSFTVREVGVFDSKDQLLAISSYPETYKPSPDSGTVKEILIKIILAVSNTASINLKIDPTVVLATLKDIKDLDTKIDEVNTNLDKKITDNNTATNKKIDDTKKDLGDKVGDTTTLSTVNKSNTVGAINELVTNLGNKSSLTTTNKTNLVSAVNEVKSSLDSIQVTAGRATIEDTDNLFTSDNVEGALKELAVEVNGQRTKGITIANNLIDMI